MTDSRDIDYIQLRTHSLNQSPTMFDIPIVFSNKENVARQIRSKKRNVSSWNDKQEIIAKDIGDMALGYKLMHIEMAQSAHLKYNIFMYVGIIFAPLSGIIAQFHFSLLPNSDYLSYIALVISFISGIFVTIIKFSRYDEVEYSNKLAASKYISLEGNVRRQLALYRDNRIDAQMYMEWLTNSFDELFQSSPLLPHHLFEKYHQLALKNGHVPPNRYGNTININEEYEQTLVKNICEVDTIVINTLYDGMQSKNPTEKIKTTEHTDHGERKCDIFNVASEIRNDDGINVEILPNKQVANEENSPRFCDISENSSPENNTSENVSGTRVNFQSSSSFSGGINKTIKRTDTLVPFQELNRYSDPMMEYQMKRVASR